MTGHRHAVWCTVALGLAVAGCHSSEDPAQSAEQEPSPATRRLQMLRSSEAALNRVLGSTADAVDGIRRDFYDSMEALSVVHELDVVDDALQTLGAEARSSDRERIRDLESRTIERLEQVLEHADQQMWEVAESAGRRERGSDPNYRSGYQELDGMVLAASSLLHQRADINGLRQVALSRATERLTLQRAMFHDLRGVGRVMLFLSEPRDLSELEGRAPFRDETGDLSVIEGVKSALALSPHVGAVDGEARVVRARTAEEVETETVAESARPPVRFLQARRAVVRKAGIVQVFSPWAWDRTTDDGLVPPVGPLQEGYLASEVVNIAPEADLEALDALRDHELALEFRSALQNSDTGEILVSLSWKVVWSVDYRGQCRVQPDLAERHVLEHDPVLESLLRADRSTDEDLGEGGVGAD